MYFVLYQKRTYEGLLRDPKILFIEKSEHGFDAVATDFGPCFGHPVCQYMRAISCT